MRSTLMLGLVIQRRPCTGLRHHSAPKAVAESEKRSVMSFKTRRACAVIAAGALAATVGFASPAFAAPNNNSVKKLTKAVTLDGVINHLEAFQDDRRYNTEIARPDRPGYQASVDYVVEQLEAAGYSPEVQPFEFAYYEENSELIRVSPDPTTFVDGSDFLRNSFDRRHPRGHGHGHARPGRDRDRR